MCLDMLNDMLDLMHGMQQPLQLPLVVGTGRQENRANSIHPTPNVVACNAFDVEENFHSQTYLQTLDPGSNSFLYRDFQAHGVFSQNNHSMTDCVEYYFATWDTFPYNKESYF